MTTTIKKTADWLLSWVYDATTGKIYTGHDHVNIVEDIPDWMEKGMANKLICGWYTRDYGGEIGTRIATDTVPQDYANKQSPIAEQAQKAAMKYWEENGLGEEYGSGDYCEKCDEYVGDIDEHNEHYHPREYCEHCDEYYNPEYEDHSGDWCPECGEHVYDIDEHNGIYHFEPEPWMPKEGEKIFYKGQPYKVYEVQEDGMHVVPWLPGGMNPATMTKSWILPWNDYLKDQKKQKGQWQEVHPNQLSLENPYPGWVDPYENMKATPQTVMMDGQPHQIWQDSTTIPGKMEPPQPLSKVAWEEKYIPQRTIIHCVDLQDSKVFAKLSYDYMGQYNDVDWDMPPKQPDQLQDSSPEGDDISQNPAANLPNEMDFTPPTTDVPSADVSLPDDPRMLDIARDWNSAEYRWSYDGTQLHMWRVFNRSAYGPSHYDMFGHEGYDSHSQGRVYVSEGGKVGMLYWQITHPECERVCNEWSLKTFGKLPDYTYRAYGPYAGRPVSRYDFPIVEVGSLPLNSWERWWDIPGGYPGMKLQKPDYPSKKKNKQPKLQVVPGPVDDAGQPITPGKGRRRKRTRNKKYRNRSFRGR